MINFEYKEDQDFFEELLAINQDSSMELYKTLFDFRSPEIKRKEFNRIRNKILDVLIEIHGKRCMLLLDCCDNASGFAVDHLIPLSSNKLNKELRNLKAEKGRKVETQSFGSNHLDNLIIACNKCNNHKKHRFLSKEQISLILKEKNSPSFSVGTI